MKKWFMNVAESLENIREYYSEIVAMVHDELVIEVDEKCVDTVTESVKLGIQLVNENYDLRCPLDCDIITGNNWSEIH